jgi:uncharacterized protein YqgC (DUF456 family)
VEFAPELLLAATLVVMALGVLGSILPVFPGGPVIFLAALVYGYLTGFEQVGALVLVTIGALTVLSFAADLWGTAYGTRRGGASWAGTVGGTVGGLVGTFVGFFFLGIGAIAGLFVGTLAGLVLGEYLRREKAAESSEENPLDPRERWQRTRRAAGGAFVGWLISLAAKFVLALLSVVVFVAALLF